MASGDPLFNECCRALEALHTNPDSAIKMQANKWLIQFQVNQEAWMVANTLLNSPDLPQFAYHFAASTFRTKLLYYFHQLDQPSWLGFRDSLFQHISRFNAGNGMQVVARQLCMCMASLVLQISHGTEGVTPPAEEAQFYWKEPLQQLANSLGTQAENAPALLSILTFVPEECCSRKVVVKSEQKRRAMREISGFSQVILQILNSYFESTADPALREKIFRCFHSWIRNADLPLDSLGGHPLLQAAFDAIQVPDLLKVACDTIGETILQTDNMERFPNITRFLVPRVLGMMTLFEQGQRQNNEEQCDKIAGVMIELAEAHHRDFIAQGSPEALKILESMLMIGRHPDQDIATHTFNFWYLFSKELTGQQDEDSDDEREEPRQRAHPDQEQRKKYFAPVFKNLLPIVLEVAKLPVGFEKMESDEAEEAKKNRYFAAETFLVCTAILGPVDILQTIGQALEMQYNAYQQNPQNWHGLEACLYAIRSVARKVENVDSEYMFNVMNLLGNFKQTQLRYTATLCVGRYSDWIAKHPQLLPSLLAYVVDGFNDKKTLASSSLAFKFVCKGCAGHLTQSPLIDNIGAVYAQSSQLPLSDRREIVEGVAAVVSAMPPTTVVAGIRQCAQPIAMQIQQILTNNKETEEGLCDELDCTAELFKSLLPKRNSDPKAVRGACVEVLKDMWPLFDQVLQRCKEDDRRMEKLGRCWKYAMRTADSEFAPLVIHLLKTLAQYYQTNPRSTFMYTVSCCVTTFGGPDYPNFQEAFHSTFTMITNKTLQLLTSAQSFTNQPDNVEDFFEMLCRYLRRRPDFLMTSPLLPKILECGIRGLHIQHREASQALCNFFSAIINKGSGFTRGPNGEDIPNAYEATVRQMLELYGAPLCSKLFEAVNGAVPEGLVRTIASVLVAILKFSRDIARTLFFNALQTIPETHGPTKEEYLQNIINQNPRKVPHFTLDFSDACRRSQKTTLS